MIQKELIHFYLGVTVGVTEAATVGVTEAATVVVTEDMVDMGNS